MERLLQWASQRWTVPPHRLQQQFNVDEPNRAWVADITHIRTHEGWLYLAVAIDLFFRQVIDWSMQSRIDRDLVLDALLMAVWRRRPVAKVIVHSDQGSQLGSYRWQSFLKARGLVASMSRRGSCHDNAVAESFFQLLNSSGSGEKSVRTAQPLARMCSNTSRCSTTR